MKSLILIFSLLSLFAHAKPNILIIIADDCTFSDLPVNGGQNAKTPHLDALAQQSLVFENAYLGMAIALPDEKGDSLYQTIMERIRDEKSSRKLEGDDWETEDYQLCDNCDTVVKFGSKFCHHCGHKL